MDNQNIKPTGCCEIFNSEQWQDKEVSAVTLNYISQSK